MPVTYSIATALACGATVVACARQWQQCGAGAAGDGLPEMSQLVCATETASVLSSTSTQQQWNSDSTSASEINAASAPRQRRMRGWFEAARVVAIYVC